MGRKHTDSCSESEQSSSHSSSHSSSQNDHCEKKPHKKHDKKPCSDVESIICDTKCKVIFGKDGKDGKRGKDGKDGTDGRDGECGKRGKTGKDGCNGKNGKDGVDGKNGLDGKDGKDGVDGKDGTNGVDGKDGTNGVDGITTYANFYGLQPLNNIPVVTPGSPVEFPNNGPATPNITRLTNSTFDLNSSGIYMVSFNLTAVESAETVIVLNGVELPETVVARSIGETVLSGTFIINVPNPNSVISLNNASNTPFTLSANSNTGSTKPLALHFNILKL
jgi:hypothetical protein